MRGASVFFSSIYVKHNKTMNSVHLSIHIQKYVLYMYFHASSFRIKVCLNFPSAQRALYVRNFGFGSLVGWLIYVLLSTRIIKGRSPSYIMCCANIYIQLGVFHTFFINESNWSSLDAVYIELWAATENTVKTSIHALNIDNVWEKRLNKRFIMS